MKRFFAFLLATALTTMLSANNITVTNVQLTGQNTSSDYAMVQFDISWDNSWRISSGATNWDAAWVFVKYRVLAASGGDGLWHHASLNDAGHTPPTGSTIDIGLLTPASAFNATTNPGLGAFIYRSANGTGTFTKTGAQLRWNYGVNFKTGSTPIGDNDIIDIQVYAIEMVYVPEGSFYVGDGATTYVRGQFNNYNSTSAFQITSESVPSTLGGSTSGNMRNNNKSGMEGGSDDFDNSTSQSLPTAFPKGFAAFYCMKYEISQQGYVDFLNTLTYTQQATRTAYAPNSVPGYPALASSNNSRNGIDIQTSGTPSTTPAVYACNLDGDGNYSETNDGEWIACNFLSWADMAAYLDWSGLRPMTELEFEKSCRGTLSSVKDEYAWGSTSSTRNTGISNSGSTNETSTNGGNITAGNPPMDGPMRVGAFATLSSTRVQAGATYYGIMEMSGNVLERPVTVGNTEGRSFTGTHGNGMLNTDGNADVSFWPSNTTDVGAGFRGGDFNTYYVFLHARVSDRANATYSLNPGGRPMDAGGRGVRTAPVFEPVIGDTYGGGIIFYIDGTGQHGLIAATSDQGNRAWGCRGTLIPGADGTAIGTGNQNTTDIMAGCLTAGIAARLCGDLVLGGYSDWYLPSYDELYQMYLQKTVIGGFGSHVYWSSTEYDANQAWSYFFSINFWYQGDKTDQVAYVRAIRSF